MRCLVTSCSFAEGSRPSSRMLSHTSDGKLVSISCVRIASGRPSILLTILPTVSAPLSHTDSRLQDSPVHTNNTPKAQSGDLLTHKTSFTLYITVGFVLLDVSEGVRRLAM